MPGQFSKTNRPKRPGAYVNWEASQSTQLVPAIASIVAIPLTHDWGPFKVATLVNSISQFRAIYGPNEFTPGFIAVKQAFQGEGLPGSAGAGAVLVHRTGSTSAAKATKILQNTTPVNAITLTAKYEGTRANNFKVTVQDYAGDAAYDELILYEGTVELERWQYLNTDITDLAAQINGTGNYAADPRKSDWVTASSVTSGSALGTVTASAFSGGNDGSTLVAQDWTDAMDALAPQRFSVIAPYNLTDSSILASLKTWVQGQNVAGKRMMCITGGLANETISTAAGASTGAALFNDENFIRVGVGSIVDNMLLDVNGAPTTLSTAQFVPRVAGMLCNFGEIRSLTFARVAGVTITGGCTDSQLITAIDGGVVALSLGSDPVAPVRIEKGVTTFTTKTNVAKPYLIYRNPKFVRTMQALELEVQEWADLNVVGKLPVNDKTRDFVIGEIGSKLRAREEASAYSIQSGWTIAVDQDPPPSDDDEFIGLVIGLKFGRSSEQVFLSFKVG